MDSEPRVEDAMATKFETISPEATVKEAVQKLYASECMGVEGTAEAQAIAVINEEGKLWGLVTMFDVLRSLGPISLREEEHPHLASLTWEGFFEDIVDMIEDKKVAEIMTPCSELEIVSPKDRLIVVVEAMIERRVSQLPVCEEGQRIAGIVRRTDVFNQVAREMLAQEN